MTISRRHLMQAGAAASFATASVTTFAQAQQGGSHAGHPGHESPYAHLTDPNIKEPPPGAMEAVRFTYSPAPASAQMGRWEDRALLPIPRSESLKDTIARVLPYYEAEIVPALQAGERVIVAAHDLGDKRAVQIPAQAGRAEPDDQHEGEAHAQGQRAFHGCGSAGAASHT